VQLNQDRLSQEETKKTMKVKTFLQLIKNLCFTLLLILFSFGGFSQSRYISETTKKIVFSRDAGICQCCGSSVNLEFDHVKPHSCGGGNEVSNIQLLCRTCNRSKSNSCYCKVHNKKVGVNCCQGNTKKNISKAKQCSGTTQQGARCKNRITHPSGRCHHHR
jgi:hypothetical protein